MPGFISGVPVKVTTDSCVAVAEGGNQTIVSVGVAVSVGDGVAVGVTRLRGRQAATESNSQRMNKLRNTFIKE
jgi:hypothetical protein